MLIIPERNPPTQGLFFLKKRIQRPLTLRLISCDLLVLYIYIFIFFSWECKSCIAFIVHFTVSHRVTQKPRGGPFPISILKLFRSQSRLERPRRATPRTTPPPRDRTLPSSDQVIRLLSCVHLRGAGVVIPTRGRYIEKGPERQTRICSSLKSRANRGDKNQTRVLIYQRRAAD